MTVSAGVRLPRGIPAASLKRHQLLFPRRPPHQSSAGNTRGLIEAPRTWSAGIRCRRLPRGIPAASLKLDELVKWIGEERGLPRGIPAASLKRGSPMIKSDKWIRLPRGIPAASLKHPPSTPGTAGRWSSSAGNTRGLIEAQHARERRRAAALSSAGNKYPRPH